MTPVTHAWLLERMSARGLSTDVINGAAVEWWRRTQLRDPCVYCGHQPTGLDHLVPRSYVKALAQVPPGLDHWLANGNYPFATRKEINRWWNLAPACSRCDNQKSNAPLLLFLMKIRRHGLVAENRAQIAKRERFRRSRRLRGL